MYQNNESLKLGEDHYNLKTGEYEFTYICNGDVGVQVEGVPDTFEKSFYSGEKYTVEVHAYIKGSDKLLSEDDVNELCYNAIILPKSRLDTIKLAEEQVKAIISQHDIKEPFIFEGGNLSVGREHVLSAHIQAGYDQGWISSSICW